MGSNAAVSEDVHGPAQPARWPIGRSVDARGSDGSIGELVAACVSSGLAHVIFASTVVSG